MANRKAKSAASAGVSGANDQAPVIARIGRPSTRDAEIEGIILEALAAGIPLRQICEDAALPAESTVRKWAVEDSVFGARYAGARSIGLDVIAEGTIEIADDLTEDPNSRRVRIDARKWLLSKMRPDKYGDRTALEHTGAGGAPLSVTVEFVKPKGE